MALYNLEIFRNYELIDQASVELEAWARDYLKVSQNTVVVPGKLEAQKNDFARLTYGKNKHIGIIKFVADDGEKTSLTLVDPMSLMDINVNYPRAELKERSLEHFIAGMIQSVYVSSDDALQNIAGLRTNVRSVTMGALLNLKDNVHDLFDVIQKAFTLYGIVLDFELNFRTKNLIIHIGKVPENVRTVEADLQNVLVKNFVLKNADESLNKITILNKFNELERVTYFRTPSDAITKTPQERIFPVRFDTIYIEPQNDTPFSDEALSRAKERLTPEKFDNLIELEFSTQDQLIFPQDFHLGQTTKIIKGAEIITSVLTAIEIGERVKLIFGAIRLELTTLLKREAKK